MQRFQRALQALRQREAVSLAALAAEAGYSDQAHFNRDFLIFAGVVPTVYQRLSPYESNHVPVANDRAATRNVNFLQYHRDQDWENTDDPASQPKEMSYED